MTRYPSVVLAGDLAEISLQIARHYGFYGMERTPYELFLTKTGHTLVLCHADSNGYPNIDPHMLLNLSAGMCLLVICCYPKRLRKLLNKAKWGSRVQIISNADQPTYCVPHIRNGQVELETVPADCFENRFGNNQFGDFLCSAMPVEVWGKLLDAAPKSRVK